MKNIAILLPGHIRSYQNTRNNIFDNLILPLKKEGHKCDIFSSVWDTSGYRENGWNGETDAKLIIQDSTAFEIEEFKRNEFIQKFNNNKWKHYSHLSGPETCGDAISMWYKVWKCYQLSQKGKYDVVFRLRPDIIFQTKFNTKFIDEISPQTVYMSTWHGKFEVVTHQIMDHFAFGDYDSMTKYCSIYPEIEQIINRNDSAFTGEGFLYSQIIHHRLNISRVPIKYGVMRSHGIENVA
jgi:hypothetical protein